MCYSHSFDSFGKIRALETALKYIQILYSTVVKINIIFNAQRFPFTFFSSYGIFYHNIAPPNEQVFTTF